MYLSLFFIALSGILSTASAALINDPEPPKTLTPAGLALIQDAEGYDGRPALPDLRYSGCTWSYGYDAHQNSSARIQGDWAALPASQPTRLAGTQPYYGKSAVSPCKAVHDVVIPRPIGTKVFIDVDMARTFADCLRAFPGFDKLRPNAQSALASLVYNRGPSMIGQSRSEMRAIRDAVPKQDYAEIAIQLRVMVRVWAGTSIFNGMKNRRIAESKLVLTP